MKNFHHPPSLLSLAIWVACNRWKIGECLAPSPTPASVSWVHLDAQVVFSFGYGMGVSQYPCRRSNRPGDLCFNGASLKGIKHQIKSSQIDILHEENNPICGTFMNVSVLGLLIVGSQFMLVGWYMYVIRERLKSRHL